ncbi:hypothetical protein [Gryllotalpicola protaetiae]|uniref:Uncharacterized protein n=1 Tax=Gryllotalpicola protaetiae TaxID=2419771 RepID=A0A387BHV2_9MICO|nr:hypothetical protein [Gryllotalpicola protaetiae]AYG03615.1 hypothetical protein D7I44_08760 [Gryllotalpicola protaetiae]
MTPIDIGLTGARVCGYLAYPDGIRIMFVQGGAYLASGGTWGVTWPDGTGHRFVADAGMGNDPETGRLMGTLLADVVESARSDEKSKLAVVFKSGLRLDFHPQPDDYEYWDSYSTKGVRSYAVIGKAPGQNEGPRPDRIGLEDVEAEGTFEPPIEGERLIDLELSDVVYGVTVLAESMQLETRSGDLFFAGPIEVTDPNGLRGVFDPKFAATDSTAGAVLKLIIDGTIEVATLAPDSSRLDIRFTDGLRLIWNAPSAQQGLFRARNRSKREFWSKGDGTIYWFGGPEGTQPKFLAGGPKRTD